MADPVFDSREQVQVGSATSGVEDVGSLADEDLLRLYRDSRCPEVFAAMVRRHQPMVLRTCLRLLGNNVHDAEDAAQSVFLVLAQRPEAVRRSLAGWLHGLARAAVSELCRSRRRRTEREEMAARLNSLFARLSGRDRPMEHHDLAEELDAALAQLPDALQQAVILRYLEGHSQQEAARRAGCTTVTLGWRSMKGLQRLRLILGRRGVAVSSATLLALFENEVQATTALGLAGAAGPATTAAASLAAVLVKRSLLYGTLRKVAVVVVLLTTTASLGAGLAFWPRSAPEAPPKVVRQPAPKPARPPVVLALGLFDRNLDIGQPARAGTARHAGDTYTVQGGGAHIYGKADQFRFVCRPFSGDGEIVARVASDPDQEARQVSAGVMFRERLTADSHHLAILLTSVECHVKFRTPADPGSGCDISRLDKPAKHWVRLVRRGSRFTASVRTDGAPAWKLVKELDLALNPSLYVGLAVTAHDDAQLATATFDRVSVRPLP
jgi:RNA polymerase sigma factor (sigma-70 family)